MTMVSPTTEELPLVETPAAEPFLPLQEPQLLPLHPQLVPAGADLREVEQSTAASSSSAAASLEAVTATPAAAPDSQALLPPTDATSETPTRRARRVSHTRDAMYGHLVLRLLRADWRNQHEGLRTARAKRLLHQLRRHLIAAGSFSLLGLIAALVLLVRTSIAFSSSRGLPQCQGRTRSWLIGLLALQLAGPACLPCVFLLRRAWPLGSGIVAQYVGPSAIVLVLFWCIGAVAYVEPQHKCPMLRSLPVEALVLQVATSVLMAVAGTYMITAQPLFTRLNDIVARGGSLAEAAGLVEVVPQSDFPPPEECSICLGCLEDRADEGEDGEDGAVKVRPGWRRLRCGHAFHEKCIFDWIKRVKRCPICRRHLRDQATTSFADRVSAPSETAPSTETASASTSAASSGSTAEEVDAPGLQDEAAATGAVASHSEASTSSTVPAPASSSVSPAVPAGGVYCSIACGAGAGAVLPSGMYGAEAV
eukprot:gnl/TRDRNA2_/TRDRNA2_150084_c0_seq1.p1 gnl/TRDRNA2_/TRDRNA2_150084_c0~~gnl/TRDRNA2_/TRDRNA2_150084_c0_seq1.p1  ORF type:complete len:479 (+),score=68.10 gnl/TRDRNA2_/TRDRNA2_150084_c0_seq1:107-1543(+)